MKRLYMHIPGMYINVAKIQNRWQFCNYMCRWAQYVSKMQSESKCYLNTAYNVISQPENLPSQTDIFPGSRLPINISDTPS